MAFSGLNRNTQHRKLETDVRTLNSAISMYLANGGSLGGLSDPNDVIKKLKSPRSKADKELHVGAPSGRLVDPRVAAVSVPADSWKLRATFNNGGNRFEVSSSGDGVEFVLDQTLAEVAATVETRSNGAVQYASNSGWVWDHGATNNPNAPQGPTSIYTNPNVADNLPVDPTPDPEPDPGSRTRPWTGSRTAPSPAAPALAYPAFHHQWRSPS
jgi:hypothetical protein